MLTQDPKKGEVVYYLPSYLIHNHEENDKEYGMVDSVTKDHVLVIFGQDDPELRGIPMKCHRYNLFKDERIERNTTRESDGSGKRIADQSN